MSNLCAFRDFGRQQRYARFCGRVVVLSILSLLLYPFLWAWTVIGTLWFRRAKDCVSFSCYWCSSIIRGNIIWQWLVYEANAPNACSCLKKVRNGVSSFGCFLATVDFFALLACPWGRLVVLFVPLHFLDLTMIWPYIMSEIFLFCFIFHILLLPIWQYSFLIFPIFSLCCSDPCLLNIFLLVVDKKTGTLTTRSTRDSFIWIWGKLSNYLHPELWSACSNIDSFNNFLWGFLPSVTYMPHGSTWPSVPFPFKLSIRIECFNCSQGAT